MRRRSPRTRAVSRSVITGFGGVSSARTMRTLSLRTVLFLLVLGSACTATPPVTVLRAAPGGFEKVDGDRVKFRRGIQDPFTGLRGGFYVVRSPEDWQNAWQTGAEKDPPATIDFRRDMIVLAVAENKDVMSLQFQRMAETAGFVHVWLRETKKGENCVSKPEQVPFDGVLVSRVDKPFRFYVEEEPAESCGAPPVSTVRCRVGTSDKWSSKLSAQPGDTLECEMDAQTQGRFAITDRVMRLGDLPGGSATKLAYSKGPTRATFTIDVFGKYTISGEATDESGRKGLASAEIEVAPPRTKDVLVQLVWTNFDVSDDPDTFPRVKLRASEKGTGRECSSDTGKNAMCDVRVHSAYTLMKVAASNKRVALNVGYVDERIDKGPLVCIQVYFDGARTVETCDRKHRNADDRWDVGTIDMSTGVIPELVTAPIGDGGVEAAAGDAGKSGDAGGAIPSADGDSPKK